MATVLALLALAQQQGKPADWVGQPMPQFQMAALKGEPVTNKTLEGKPYIVDFWATWCGPCKKAAPTLQAIHAKLGEKGLVVIGANAFEQSEGPANAANYVKQNGYTYTFTYGNDDLARRLNVTGIPAFFFVGKDGVVKQAFVGYGDGSAEKFWAAAQALIEG